MTTRAGTPRLPRNLMDALGAGLLPELEFRTILAAHFPEGVQQDPRVVTYGRNGDTATSSATRKRSGAPSCRGLNSANDPTYRKP